MRRTLLLASAVALLAPGLAARAACPPDEAMEGLALRIVENRPGEPLSGMKSLADGQCAQDKLVALLSSQFGRPVGYKVGLTDHVMQQRFGVRHPVAGTIYEATLRLRDGAEVPVGFAAIPAVQADLLVRVRDEAINAARTHEEILGNLDRVVPFIGLPDFTMPPAKFDGPNLLAFNVGVRLGVSGEPIPLRADAEFTAALGAMTVTVTHDTGRELSRAQGTALLGHPLDVLPWLAEDLSKRGKRLQAGDVVSLGNFSPPLPAEAGRRYIVRYEGLAPQPVTVSVQVR
jgi:2-keto-4-pentenoate hydratase